MPRITKTKTNKQEKTRDKAELGKAPDLRVWKRHHPVAREELWHEVTDSSYSIQSVL